MLTCPDTCLIDNLERKWVTLSDSDTVSFTASLTGRPSIVIDCCCRKRKWGISWENGQFEHREANAYCLSFYADVNIALEMIWYDIDG